MLPEAATHVYVMAPSHGGFFPIVPLVIGFFVVAFLVRGLAWRGRGGLRTRPAGRRAVGLSRSRAPAGPRTDGRHPATRRERTT